MPAAGDKAEIAFAVCACANCCAFSIGVVWAVRFADADDFTVGVVITVVVALERCSRGWVVIIGTVLMLDGRPGWRAAELQTCRLAMR
jgi:hypothetical protein